MAHVEVPALVRRRALDLGEVGQAWLEGLDDTVTELVANWELELGPIMHGGANALVAEVHMADGLPAILKVAVPDPRVGTLEADILEAAEGRGYARLYRRSPLHRAMVVERLGQQLWAEQWPQDQEMELYCGAIREAWKVEVDPKGLTDGPGKAAWLKAFIPRAWEGLGRPCDEGTIALALEFAARRGAASDPSRAVICHGDAHPGNLLAALEHGGTHKFIDPEGAFIEPEYDLACWLRGWRPAHLPDPDLERHAREAAAQLAALTGTHAQAIWEWGLAERVSSGLVLMRLGHEEGALYLSTADQLASEEQRGLP